jgi:acyl-CoA synthetase (AMP-forming)/AMP-acid ligase II
MAAVGRAPFSQRLIAALNHDHLAVIGPDQTLTGRELLGHAGGAARSLDELGIAPGTAIPALLVTAPDAVALMIAGALTGRPLAPLNPRMTSAELRGVLAGLRARRR